MGNRALVFFVLVGVFLSLATSCVKQRCNLPTETTMQPQAISKSLKVDVFLDGTSSMKGFIVPGIASRYQQALPFLESIVERGWSGGTVAFYRFGTIIEDLPERRYLEAQRPKFYMDERVFKETLIQNVIDRASLDNLSIVVTDLFQTDVDVNLITKKIKEKYVANNLAIGVLAVKSEFSGQVFDLGPNNYTFSYASDNDDPATFRPFYVLALGKHADVSNYLDQARKTGLGNSTETQMIVFSPYITEKIVSFEGSALTEINKLQEVRDLLPTDAASESVKQFRIPDSSTPLASFSAKLDYKPLAYIMPVASLELEPEIVAFKCESGLLQANPDAQRAFAIKEARLNESMLDFKAEIVPSFLPSAGIYCFKVSLFPKEYKTPEWFAQWNMSGEQVEAAMKDPKQFKGSTTFNLETFFATLWATTLQLHRPKVAEFYCYVKKD